MWRRPPSERGMDIMNTLFFLLDLTNAPATFMGLMKRGVSTVVGQVGRHLPR